MTTFTWSQDLISGWQQSQAGLILAMLLCSVIIILSIYGFRQIFYSLNRMFSPQNYPYTNIGLAQWPQITVFIAAHNEEQVIAESMTALLNSDYPEHLIKLVVVNDRSSDLTAQIVDAQIKATPGRITAFHRTSGKPGKAAAIKDAMHHALGDIAIIFDADYTPAPNLIRQLVIPFFDPEVGAVMGRVVPRNVSTNLLTRMLDIERSAGYQVDQQARMNLRAVPQFGGTVGGVRISAVKDVGGWNDDALTEDTDITFRLLIKGWKTVYNNAAACYEEVPEEWAVRLRQVHRWAQGHNQVLIRQLWALATSRTVTWRERLDGILLLNIFLVQPLLLIGWVAAIFIYYLNGAQTLTFFIPAILLVTFSAVGGLSVFLQMAYGVLLDGNRQRIRLLPMQMFNFIVSLPVISFALWSSIVEKFKKGELVWNKTKRYRKVASAQ